jgi:3-methyladenine DNA glycosylase/8-oxoguanine DNA glycosylase
MDLSDLGNLRGKKTSYIKALSFAVISKIDYNLCKSQKNLSKSRDRKWTIDVYLMFCLQAPAGRCCSS